MPEHDDIPLDKPATTTEHVVAPISSADRREIGPESEVRGGGEMADEDLDDDTEAEHSTN